MKSKVFLFCAMLMLIAVDRSTVLGFAAQESLSLDEALRIAYHNNPRMQVARQEIKVSKGRWFQAEALPAPEAELAIGGLKKNENGSRKGNLDSFSITQPLDPFGTRYLRGRIAKDEIGIAEGRLDLVWGEVRSQVITLYATIQAEEKALGIAQDNLNATRQFFTRVTTQFQAGNALQSDVVRARIEVARAQNDLLVGRKNLKVSTGELNLALGRSYEEPLLLSDALIYEALSYEYEKLRDMALSRRADIRQETLRLGAKKKGVTAALLRTFLPEMAFGVERTTEDFENDTGIVLEASYPLWGFNLGEVEEAKAEKTGQDIRLEALKRSVGLEVYQAYLEAELADKQVLLQKKSIEEANELLRQITLRYAEGKVSFLTYLENIKTIKETRVAYFEALRNYKVMIAELQRVVQATPAPEGESS